MSEMSIYSSSLGFVIQGIQRVTKKLGKSVLNG